MKTIGICGCRYCCNVGQWEYPPRTRLLPMYSEKGYHLISPTSSAEEAAKQNAREIARRTTTLLGLVGIKSALTLAPTQDLGHEI